VAQFIDVEGVGIVEFPDEMSGEDIEKKVKDEIWPAHGIEQKGGFLDALSAGVDNLQISGLSGLQGAALKLGADEYAASLEESIKEQKRQRAEALPDQMMFTEAQDAGDVWQAFREAAGTSLPISAPGIIGGIIGGGKAGAALGTMLGPVGTLGGTAIGGIIGGIIGGTIPFYGLNRERQKEVYGEVKNELAAIGAAIPQAAADALISRIIPGVGRGFEGGIMSRIMKGIGAGATTEAPTEVVQQVLERAQAGLDIFSDDAMSEYKEAAIAGFALGGGFGGVTGPFNVAKPKGEVQPPGREDEQDRKEEEAVRMQTAEEARRLRDDYRAKKSAERRQRRLEGVPLLEGPAGTSAADRVLSAEAEKRSMFPSPKLAPVDEEAQVDDSILNDDLIQETTAELSAQAQAKNIQSRPDEEVFTPEDLGSYGAQVTNYFSIRQPGKELFSVNDLRDAGVGRSDIDAIAEQKDDLPGWAAPDSAQSYEIRGKAIAKSRGYGIGDKAWKSLIQELTGKDTVSDIPLRKMGSFFSDLQALEDKTPEARAKRSADREKLDADEREALAEDLYQRIIGKFRQDGVVDIPSVTRSKEEGGMGIAPGEARKVIQAAEKRGDLRQVNGEYALDISMGPRVQGTPEPVGPGQSERLRIEETAARVTPDYKGQDAGWTFERDGVPQKIYPTRKAATEARNAAFKAGSRDVSSVFKGRPGYTVFRDVMEGDTQVNIAPLGAFNTLAEADAAAAEIGIPMEGAQRDAKRKRDAKRSLEQTRETARRTREKWKSFVSGPQKLTTNAEANWSEIKSSLRRILDGMGMGKVALEIGRFRVDVEGQFVEPNAKYANGVIRLAMDLPNFEGASDTQIMAFMAEVMDHEIIHALKENKAFTEQQWEALVEAGKKRKIKVGDQEMTFWDYQKLKIGDDLVYEVPEGGLSSNQVLYGGDVYKEEVVADMFREWAKNGGKFPGAPASIFRKIMDLLQAIKRAFSDKGFQTADQIFEGAQSGSIAAQEGSALAPEIGEVDFEVAPLVQNEAAIARASRIPQSMYEFQMRVAGGKEGGGKTITRRVMATDPKDARRKALEQMKRTRGAYEVQGVKEWKPLIDRLSRKMPDGVPETAQRYSRRQVADRSRFEGTADFEKWFKGAALQDADGNPIILYRGTRGSVLDEQGRSVPSPEIRINELGLSFFSFDPKFTEMFSQPEFEPDVVEGDLAPPPGYIRIGESSRTELPRTIPVISNVKTPFDPGNEEHWSKIKKAAKGSVQEDKVTGAHDGYKEHIAEVKEFNDVEDSWRFLETPAVLDAMKQAGFDSTFLFEEGVKNLAIFDPKQVKSIFNRFEEGAAESARYSRNPRKLMEFISNNPDGFTLEIDSETVPKSGYVLAPVKQSEIIIPTNELDEETALKLIEAVDALTKGLGEKAMAGGWLNENDGLYYLDASRIYDNLEDAIYASAAGDQEGFFDLGEGNVFDTKQALEGLKQSGSYSDRRLNDARAENRKLAQRFTQERLPLRRRRGEQSLAEGERLRSRQLDRPSDWRSRQSESLGETQDQFAELEGLEPAAFGPNPDLQRVAEEYAAENGLPYSRQPEYVAIDRSEAKRLAKAYADMKHDPKDPEVREAYRDLIDQTVAQYRALKRNGYSFYLMDPNNDPYGTPREAIEDLLVSKTMGVYPTRSGFGSDPSFDLSDNPLLEEVNIQWPDPSGKMVNVTANDLFRAVHDALGHGPEGAAFRGRGEENAWLHHSKLYYGKALRALASETRGQNSWLNYGPHGKKNRTASVEDTTFADQKVGLMPEWSLARADEGKRYSRISPRRPTGASAQEDPSGGALQIGTAHVLDNTPENREKIVRIIKSYPGFKTRKRTPEAVVEEFQEFLTRNILFLYDQVDPAVRERSKLWYDGARHIVDKWQKKYGVNDFQIAGVLAALSPQKDWYQNVSLAERVLDIHTKFTRGNNRAWIPDAAMLEKAQQLYMTDSKGRRKDSPSKNVNEAMLNHIMSRPYEDITHPDPKVANEMRAMWLRTWDQANNHRGYRTVTPEGNFVGDADGVTAWGSNSEIGKAIGSLMTTDIEEISSLMGDRHKVRSFYNNIFSPQAMRGDVTIDTHAFAAALLRALSGNSYEVAHGFGNSLDSKYRVEGREWESAPSSAVTGAKGLYGIYADAYREAARLRGVLPREMQSITWEAVRGLFPKNWKRAANVQAVDNIWREFERGDITLDQAHQLIMEASPNGGVGQPTWLAEGLPTSAADGRVENSSYDGELSGLGVSRRYSRRTPGDGTTASAARLLTSSQGTKSFGLFLDENGKPRYRVQIDGARFKREVIDNREHKHIGKYSHLDNFKKYTPAKSASGVLRLLEIMLQNFAVNPGAPEFRASKQFDGGVERDVIHWKNEKFTTPGNEVRLVLEKKDSPVGEVRSLVTFFPVVPTYTLRDQDASNGAMRFSRVPEVTPETTMASIGDLSLNQAQGMVGMAIQKVFRNGLMQKFRIAFQDKMLPIQQLLTELKKKGHRVDDMSNPYLQEALMHGALGDAHDRQDRKLFRPILKQISDSNVSFEELGEYLIAQHAEERNAYVEKLGGSPGGSGVSNPAAYKSSVEGKLARAGKLDEVKRLADLAYRIIDNTNQIRLKAGLISREQYEAGRAQMPFYVPLRGKMEQDIDPDALSLGGSRATSGVFIQGSEDMKIRGRQDMAPAKDVLAHIISQNKMALSRAYRNNVARSVYNLAANNPNSNMVQIITEANKREYFTEVANINGKIIRRVDPNWKNNKEMFWLKIDGQDVGVHFPGGEQIVTALRASSDPISTGPVVRALLGFNRFLANMNTSWNPEFLITNFLRDIQTAGIMANAAEVKGLSMAILKDVAPALKAVTVALRDNRIDGELGRSFEEMRRAGGTTEYMGINDMDATMSRMDSEMKSFAGGGLGKSRRMVKGVLKFVEDYNKVAENATRLATYHNARKRGMSISQAAYLAKNITVNFNRGGTRKGLMNGLFLFYNASLQGTHAMWHAIKRSKKMQAVIGGVIAAGFMSDLVNSLMSDEDDDGRLVYDKLPDYVLHRNLVFMVGGEAKTFAKVPMPYGFNAFFNLGRVLSKLSRNGYENNLNAFGDMVLPMLESFNPLGGTSSFVNFAAPTIADPIIDIYTNKDFANRPIVPQADNPFAKYDQPYSQRYWNSTTQPFKDVAAWMNELTGGNEFEKGMADVSPEVLEYMYDYVLGGLGKFAVRVGQVPGTVSNAIEGDWSNVEVNSVPLARQVIGNVTSRNDVEAYIRNTSDVLTKLNAYEGFVEMGLRKEAGDYLKANADKIRLGKYIQKIDRQLADIRLRETKIKANANLSDEKKEELLGKYREQKDLIIVNANKLYYSITR